MATNLPVNFAFLITLTNDLTLEIAAPAPPFIDTYALYNHLSATNSYGPGTKSKANSAGLIFLIPENTKFKACLVKVLAGHLQSNTDMPYGAKY